MEFGWYQKGFINATFIIFNLNSSGIIKKWLAFPRDNKISYIAKPNSVNLPVLALNKLR